MENENLKECCKKQQLEISSMKKRSRLSLSQQKKNDLSTP
ncbi:Adhesion defective protein 2 [Frankliniella fusca]|uniref:Adhesion defective protein 2 n=1 Tax=Frankliniella fusca TaxID=407009 RepID=A0AAE1HPG4_9NEOP|nr:Adhesion defective protein 2 [Frankliniella fusca]